jgi:hypothetical protein
MRSARRTAWMRGVLMTGGHDIVISLKTNRLAAIEAPSGALQTAVRQTAVGESPCAIVAEWSEPSGRLTLRGCEKATKLLPGVQSGQTAASGPSSGGDARRLQPGRPRSASLSKGERRRTAGSGYRLCAEAPGGVSYTGQIR